MTTSGLDGVGAGDWANEKSGVPHVATRQNTIKLFHKVVFTDFSRCDDSPASNGWMSCQAGRINHFPRVVSLS
ncbi:protein of unknown function [Candidatus Nitrospira inopinata]|uniref:Uncharacterized protein n=1 Tax=Candidatus Nitrospira inopinata TaxID=1715989 RepID=A0A0S4KUQ7_9BACT|nr:protein of unknown function [Candidatus Nitrospira inopinata]